MSEVEAPAANAGTANETEKGGVATGTPPAPPVEDPKAVDKTPAKGKDPAKDKAQDKTPPPPPVEKKKSVRVIVEKGTLGPLLLVNGDVTDNAEYVALLEVKGQKKVELVK